MSASSHRSVQANKGFSLVELMIALVIGLIIVLGAGQLVILGVQSFREMDELARRQEALRYMTDILSEDIRSAFNVNSQNETITDADQQSVQVSTSGKVLTLEYYDEIDADGDGVRESVGRSGMPYCDISSSPPEHLHWVRYEFAAGDLSVSQVCHAEGDAYDHDAIDWSTLSSEVVVSDLVDVTFSDAADGEPSTYDVTASFPRFGEETGSKTFTFLVTNRIKAMAAINPSSSDF